MSGFPNTSMLIEATFRAIAGRSRRHAVEHHLGVDLAVLRDPFDRDDPTIDRLHVRLKKAVVARQKAAEVKALKIHGALAAVGIAQDVRLRDLRRAAEVAAAACDNAEWRASEVMKFEIAFFADMLMGEA